MTSIKFSLERLDDAVQKLDMSVTDVEKALYDFVPAGGQVSGGSEVIDVDFVARRLDRAIETVEQLLDEGE